MEKMETSGKRKVPKPALPIIVVILAMTCAGVAAMFLFQAKQVRDMEKARAEYAISVAKNAEKVDIATALRLSTTKKVKKVKMIPKYSVNQLYKMDMRKPTGITVSDLRLVTSAGLVGLEKAFVEAEQKYGVNCIFLMSIASHESAKGTMMFRPNNMFGYGRSGFSSKAEGIQVVAKGLSTRYLNRGAPTIRGVNGRYAATPTWTPRVAAYMAKYYAVISAHRKDALKHLE